MTKAKQIRGYQEANPMAANLGTATGDVAGYALPAGYGVVKGAQLGAKGAGMLANRLAPELANNSTFAGLAKLYGRATGAATGGTIGAQTGAAAPGVITGDPGRAVAGAEIVNQYANQIPGVNPLGGATGLVVPAVAGYAAEQVRAQRERQEQARAVLAQPPTSQNFIARSRAMAELYGGLGK